MRCPARITSCAGSCGRPPLSRPKIRLCRTTPITPSPASPTATTMCSASFRFRICRLPNRRRPRFSGLTARRAAPRSSRRTCRGIWPRTRASRGNWRFRGARRQSAADARRPKDTACAGRNFRRRISRTPMSAKLPRRSCAMTSPAWPTARPMKCKSPQPASPATAATPARCGAFRLPAFASARRRCTERSLRKCPARTTAPKSPARTWQMSAAS